jgi:hypothetical protein
MTTNTRSMPDTSFVSAQDIAGFVLQNQNLSEWQVEFLTVALAEIALLEVALTRTNEGTVTGKDCVRELTQMHSAHRMDIVPVAHALTGLKFECIWRYEFDGKKVLFKMVSFERIEPMTESAFNALNDRLGWGSNAHRAALSV